MRLLLKDNTINKELFKERFSFQDLSDMQRKLFEPLGTHANKHIVQIIKSGLIDLNKEIKKMSEDEIEIEEPNKIIDAAAQILDYNERQTQSAKGLKILTQQQMLSRLPIS